MLRHSLGEGVHMAGVLGTTTVSARRHSPIETGFASRSWGWREGGPTLQGYLD
jgi:hypothetical protein